MAIKYLSSVDLPVTSSILKTDSNGVLVAAVAGTDYLSSINSSLVTSALGYTPVPTTRTITINGTTLDLSANRSWTISAGTGTVTSVSGTGGYGGLTLSGTVTSSGNITLGGTPTGTWPISISGNSETATTASIANTIDSFDTRAIATTPQTYNKSVRFDFKQNSTNGLSDGGTYNGVMYWRKYGSTTDWTGGGAIEIAYTDNGNLWHRYGSSTSWGSWRRVWNSSDFSSTNISNWNTAYGWGNHAGLYLGVSDTAVDSNKLGGVAAASYALLASPSFSGTPTAPTAATATNNTQIATTAFVKAQGYTSNTGTVTSVSGTGSYGGLTLTGTITTSGSLTLGGTPTGTWPISVSGNAATATSATTATSAATWTTARTITIGSTGKAVNGSVNVSWSLAEIGAAASSHTHAISDVTGLQTALDGKAATSHTHNISSITDSTRWWNNFGDNHGTRTAFDATTPSYGFGWRYIQGSTNGPGTSGTQFYSLYVGLGNDYAATGAGSYGMYLAIDRNVDNPYLSIRYNENNSLSSWRKIRAGAADYATSAGSASSANYSSESGYATSAGYATNAGTSAALIGLTINSSGNPVNPDNVTQNQLGYNTNVSLFGQSDGGLYSSAHSSSWIHQIYGDFRTGQIAIRGKNNGTWQAWRSVLDSSNYTTWAATSNHTHDLMRYSLRAPSNVDSMTSSNFRSQMFGSSSSGWNLSTGRWNSVPTGLSGMNMYGTLFAWSGSDTHGFIATDYSTANIQVGGGSGDSITWRATLIHSGNIASQSVSYADESGYSATTGSVLWTNVSGRPTTISSFTNDSGYITSSGSISGTSAGVLKTVSGTNSAELVRGNMGDNDQARILVGATASNAGYLEIATADDGTEPIYVRQYTGVFSTLTRTATLLDGSGNTSFPGTVTAPTFSGSLSGNATSATTATTATTTTGNAGTATTLQTARTLTIGNTGKTFNGSANVSWSLAEIGAQAAGSYAAASHTHAISDVTGLQTALDGKAASSHTHTIAQVTGLQTALDGKLSTSGKAADSELVDGIDSSRIIYGDGGFGSTSWSDMNNTAQKSGFFFYNNPTGNPFGDWTHWINSMGNSWNPNYGFQIAHAFHTDAFAVRRVTNGSFGSWRTIFDSLNYSSYVVPKTGGSFTGGIGGTTFDFGGGGYIGGATTVAATLSANNLQSYGYVSGSSFDFGGGGYIGGDTTVAGNLTCYGEVTAYSDLRLKKDVKTIDSALEKVKSLRGVEYTMKSTQKQSIGVIAQEVINVIPQVVSQNEEGMHSVAYGNIVAVLIEAIKEQQSQIEELKSKLDSLCQ